MNNEGRGESGRPAEEDLARELHDASSQAGSGLKALKEALDALSGSLRAASGGVDTCFHAAAKARNALRRYTQAKAITPERTAQ